MAWGSTWQETGQRGETRRGKRCWGGNWKGSVREPSAERAGARCSRPCIARNREIVKKNLLLVRYSFERLAKSFKRGELQRRWGGKVTIGKTRSKSEVRGKRVRGMAGVVRAGQGVCVVGCCEGGSKRHTQDRRMRRPNSLHEPVGHPTRCREEKCGKYKISH